MSQKDFLSDQPSTLSGEDVLLVHLDDQAFARDRVRQALEGRYRLVSCASADTFFETLEKEVSTAIVLIDIDLKDESTSGTAVASRVKELYPHVVILMHSNLVDGETVSSCLSAEADNFIAKGGTDEDLAVQVAYSYEIFLIKNMDLNKENFLGQPLGKTPFAGKFMAGIRRRAVSICRSAVQTVHIAGESGVGKELVADLFAEVSGKQVVKVNCGALAENLIESELFGSIKGAFTGSETRVGLVEKADGGWLFLDEVGELSLAAQKSLLRVLSSKREFMRVGENRVRTVDIKVISATNRCLRQMVELGQFRRDLWQRLCSTTIDVPPLRARKDELGDIIEYFCQYMAGGPYSLDKAARAVLEEYDWRDGNIRELENCLKAMTEQAIGKTLPASAIPKRIFLAVSDKSRLLKSQAKPPLHLVEVNLDSSCNLKAIEKNLLPQILKKLRIEDGKLSKRLVASRLGVTRPYLEKVLEKLLEEKVISLREYPELVATDHLKGDE